MVFAYGKALQGGLAALWMAGVAAAIAVASSFLGILLAALADMRVAMLINALWAFIYLGGAWLLVPSWGALGVLVACGVAYAVHAGAMYRVLSRKIWSMN